MKKFLTTALCVATLSISAAAFAQDHNDHDRNQFNDHDRQVTQDWYQHNRGHAPRGLRDSDRLNAEQDARLQAGHKFDRDLQKRSYAVPSDLRRNLPRAPAHHKYVTVGGRIVLVDTRSNLVRDVIRIQF